MPRIRYGYVQTKKIMKKPSKLNLWFYKEVYNKKPTQDNKIIFISFGGKYYSDSPKYLYEYLYNNYGDKFEYVWVINDPTVENPGNPKKVK